MKISLNFIRYYQKLYNWSDDTLAIGVDALVEKIGSQLGAVEAVVDITKKYEGIIITKVVECQKLDGSDHLNVCKIEDGGKAQNVERDENGRVQVVCGAPNCREGLTVAWLPPGTTVPDSADKDPLVLEAREIRGAMSNGMLASLKELAINDDHNGILEIDDDVAPGTSFAEKYDLAGDYVVDIENKMFTHRPDCFGFLGVAREIAGIQQMPFKSPDWYVPNPQIPNVEAEELKLEIQNELPELVLRFAAIAMSGVEVRPSPVWLQVELSKAGLKPINNIVDYTNYYMLLTGQPLHAYDYDKVKNMSKDGAKIVVRQPKPGEKIKLLNGKEIEPRKDAITITTDKQLIGIGGVMGGSDTEVDENTKNIIIECASFDMYSIRRTSMEHGLFTDAVTRFTKGQSPLQNLAVLAKIVDEVRKSANGKVASEVIDINQLQNRDTLYPPVAVTARFINNRLGLKLSAEEIKKLLENVEFRVDASADSLNVAAPFWRTDIEIPEDIVEEVGRLYGYDKLPLELPKRSIKPAEKDELLELKSKIRATLAKAGANEVLTYSFVHGNLLDKVGQDRGQAFQVANALSPYLQYYRLSLTPSLLDKVHANIKAGFDEFAMFEIGKGHNQGHVEDTGLPKEVEKSALVVSRNAKSGRSKGSAYYEARKYLDTLADELGLSLNYEPISEELDYQTAKPFDLKRSAHVVEIGSGNTLGIIGEFRQSVANTIKLPQYCAGFEISTLKLLSIATSKIYTHLSRFPKVAQDITLKVFAELPYEDIHGFMRQKLQDTKPENCHVSIKPIAIYQKEDDKAHKQITFRLTIASYERTLTDAEVSKLLDQVSAAVQEKLKAERI